MGVELVREKVINHHIDYVSKLTLTPNYKILALSLLLLPLLIFLGFWQLDRAQEKKDLLSEFNHRLSEQPITLNSLERLDNYTQVVIRGNFINNQQWLLDNRVRKGRVGYEVITPFQLSSGDIVLMNRGWVEAPRLRDNLPDVSVEEHDIYVHASAYKPLQNTLVPPHAKSASWPVVINAINLDSMSAESKLPLNMNYLRIDENSPAALTTDWRVINTQPEKHTAYAMQWFVMALALLILMITSNSNIISLLKKIPHEGANHEY